MENRNNFLLIDKRYPPGKLCWLLMKPKTPWSREICLKNKKGCEKKRCDKKYENAFRYLHPDTGKQKEIYIFTAFDKLVSRKWHLVFNSAYPALVFANETYSDRLSLINSNPPWPFGYEAYVFPTSSALENMYPNPNGTYTFLARLTSGNSPFKSDSNNIEPCAIHCDKPRSIMRIHCLEELLSVACFSSTETVTQFPNPILISSQHKLNTNDVMSIKVNPSIVLNNKIKPFVPCHLIVSPLLRFSISSSFMCNELFLYYDIVCQRTAHDWWLDMVQLTDTHVISHHDRQKCNKPIANVCPCPTSCLCAYSPHNIPMRINVNCARNNWPMSTDANFMLLMHNINQRLDNISCVNHNDKKYVSLELKYEKALLRKPQLIIGNQVTIEMKNFILARAEQSVTSTSFNYCSSIGK